ncbi:conserved exported protein of unknown function [Tenacibaculum sp. 190524A02b]|uniref:hypothetical protein n=1 Tax=Tenacibaculum vairaonense TaxID=3137860 RepID=UPI0032B25472
MKKLFIQTFLVLTSLFFFSCSGNDDNPEEQLSVNEIKMTVNGEELIFNKVVVGTYTYHAYGENIPKLTGTIDNSTDKIITIILRKNDVGSGSLAEIEYHEKGVDYRYSPIITHINCSKDGKITFVTSENDGANFAGVFSGRIQSCPIDTRVINYMNITNGSFKVKAK